eukprot:scaffold7744_cov90-Cylindrotheca_fusiformis.AAC.2
MKSNFARLRTLFGNTRSVKRCSKGRSYLLYSLFGPKAQLVIFILNSTNSQSIRAASTMNYDQSLSCKKSNFMLFSKSGSNPFLDAADSANRDRTNQRETYQPPEVAKREETNILRAKILLAFIILLAASAVGASTYLLVKD